MRALTSMLLLLASTTASFALERAAAEGSTHAAGGVDAARLADADQLIAAASAVIDTLPSGDRARDELRAFRTKIHSLRAEASSISPTEWDAMLSALLDADYYGIDDLLQLLSKHAPDEDQLDRGAAAEADEASCGEGADGAGGKRRLQEQEQQEQPPRPPRPPQSPQPPQPPQPHPSSSQMHAKARAGSQPSWGLGAVLWSWRRWLLDRPPPWERDCDCCFNPCPCAVSGLDPVPSPRSLRRTEDARPLCIARARAYACTRTYAYTRCPQLHAQGS